jgi:nucleotide sugar dehydrogenase
MSNILKNVCIQGLGYVGAASLAAVANARAKTGRALYKVIGIDLNTKEGLKRIKAINSGRFPFKSNDNQLNEVLLEAKKEKRILATSKNSYFSKADVIIVNVPLDINWKLDAPKFTFDQFDDAIDTIAKHVNPESLILIETTVPPGTCEKRVVPILEKIFLKRKISIDKIKLAYSYERVTPGPNYLDSIINSWRVYSGYNKESEEICKLFLSSFINTKKYPLTKLSSLTATETAKVMENSYRAVNIAFIEEWANFSEILGLNVHEIITAIKKRPTHSNIMQPGFGVGGYCLTKDPLFPGIASKQLFNIKSLKFPFSEMGVKINNNMPIVNLKRLVKFVKSIKNKNILILGAAYKSDVDDVRHSPTELFYKEAIAKGAKVDIHDPYISYWENLDIKILNKLPSSKNYQIIVLAVSHSYYKDKKIINWLKKSSVVFFDTVHLYMEDEYRDLRSSGVKTIITGRGDM